MQSTRSLSRYVVVLLLVFGLLVKSFSGSAFAESTTGQYPYDLATEKFRFDFTIDGVNVGHANWQYIIPRKWSVDSYSLYVQQSYSNVKGYFRYEMVASGDLIINVALTNTTDKPIAINDDQFTLQLPKLDRPDVTDKRWEVGDSAYQINSVVTDSPSLHCGWMGNRGELYIIADPSLIYNGKITIPAYTSYEAVINVGLTRRVHAKFTPNDGVVDPTMMEYGAPHATAFDFATNVLLGPALSVNDCGLVNDTFSYVDTDYIAPGDNAEQQHKDALKTQESIDKQTQQQKEQYDDFTQDGATEGSQHIEDTDKVIKDKIGLFQFADDVLTDMLSLFLPPEGDPVLTLPAFNIDVDGQTYNVWEDTSYNLATHDDKFNALMVAVRFATVVVVYFALINYLIGTFNRIFGGHSDD